MPLRRACFAGASHEGDDRNRTGVDGFAVRRKTLLSAYLSGFGDVRCSQMPSKNARAGTVLGQSREL